MNYNSLLATLTEGAKNKSHAQVFVAYLKQLTADPRNGWAQGITEKQAADLYTQVMNRGLYIDGETITLQYKGGRIAVDYDYHAYLNLLLKKYPETTIAHGIVYDGDGFTFERNEQGVTYSHKSGNPFAVGRAILGAYAVVKNRRGEFIETINAEDIDKFEQTARTKNVWKAWRDRMVLKSVIKRICKSAFDDITGEIDQEDNEDYNLDLVGISLDIQKRFAECQSVEDITALYKELLPKTENANGLVEMCATRKAEILKEQEDGTNH